MDDESRIPAPCTRGSARQALLVTAACAAILLLSACRDSSHIDLRTLAIETSEVTSPDVAVSPDGETLVFSLLGHLFRLPEAGGEAEQLTFGPFYDEDPAFSPDGRQIVFASDRGGGEANLFILDLGTGAVRQVTEEYWAARPAWSPDGSSLTYLSYGRGSVRCAGKAGIHRVPTTGGSPEALTDRTRVIRSVDFDANGDLVWVTEEKREELDPETGHAMFRSLVERMLSSGEGEIVASIDGRVDRMMAHPAAGYLAHLSVPWVPRGALVRVTGDATRVELVEVTRRYCPYRQPRFDVGPQGEWAYLGDDGRLWRISTLTGARDSIPFVARAEIPVRPATPAPQTDLRTTPSALEISFPDRAADGSVLVFGAIAKIWLQRDPDVPTESLTGPFGIERMPALAPDGRRVAFVAANGEQQDLVLVDLDSGTRRTLSTGPYFWNLAWHPGGERLIAAEESEFSFIVTSLDLATGSVDTVVAATGEFFFPPRPHFSADGSRLFYTIYGDGQARLYGLEAASGERNLVATLPDYLSNVQVSPDGAWLGFRRNDEVWVTALQDANQEISLQSGTLVSGTGGRSFRWSEPGKVLYSDGASVLEYEVASGERHPIPVRLTVERSPRPPLLVERARVLDFDAEGFGQEVALLVRDGAIEWIDDPADRELPGGVERLDAEGRFVIPGLIEPHMHIEAPWWLLEVDQRALLANGVTTMRDVGEPLYWTRSLDERSRLTAAPLARYLFSGEMLQYYISGRESGGVGYAHSSMLVHDEAAVRKAIRQHARGGARLIKAYASLPMNLLGAASDEAHRLGLPVVAHGTNVKEVVRGVVLGYSFLEHLDGTSRFYDDLQRLMAEAGTYWTPTLSIMGGTAMLFMPEEAMDTPQGEFFRFLQRNELGDLAAARELGMNVLIGTDNPEPGGVGVSMHREMQSFVLAGYTPPEVLRLATRDAAVALGIDESVGTLETGKLADFVILNEDPLVDITNTRDIWRVVKDGRVYDPAELALPERAER